MFLHTGLQRNQYSHSKANQLSFSQHKPVLAFVVGQSSIHHSAVILGERPP